MSSQSLLELVETLLDAIGELFAGEDPVRGVDLEAVVLGRVVAAGEGDAGGSLAFENHDEATTARARREGSVSAEIPFEAMSWAAVAANFSDSIRVSKPTTIRSTGAFFFAQRLEDRLHDHPNPTKGQLAADDAAPSGSSEVHHE